MVVAVVTLGLGIGLSTTMLTMLDTILHPYVPYRDVERLYTVSSRGGGRWVTAFDKYTALIESSQSFESVGASVNMGMVLVEAQGNAIEGYMTGVTGNYFPILGMTPETGRFFSDGPSGPDEDKIVVGFSFWQQMLASQPLNRGISLTLDGRTYTVIGVMPAEERTGGQVIVRLPGLAGLSGNQRNSVTPVARLKPGVTEEGAYAELKTVAARLSSALNSSQPPFTYRLFSMNPGVGRLSDFQVAMAGAAFAVLLIACTNLANLMLVRGLNRRKEMAVRLAMGAGRGHLIRQFMTECSVVGILGGALGTLLATWGVGLLRLYLPASGRWIGFLAPRADWRIVAFAIGVSVLATLLFGLLPAFTASDVSLNEPLKEGGGTITGKTKHRYSALVIAEVGISLVVLMAAGLMLRQLDRSNAFVTDSAEKGVIQGRIGLVAEKMTPGFSASREFGSMKDRFLKVPGVLDVGMWTSHRGEGGAIVSDFETDTARFVIGGFYIRVTEDYIRITGRRVIAGRAFEPGDRFNPVAMVDEWMADRLWPGMSPVGRMVKLGGAQTTAPWVRVVGLLRSPPSDRPAAYGSPSGELFVMMPESNAASRGFVIRTSANTAVVGTALRRIVSDMYPVGTWNGGYFWDEERSKRDALKPFSFITNLFSLLGGLSLGLAAVGLYGVLAYSVAQRMREFGIRLALGAEMRAVFRIVMHDAAVMLLAGTAIGAWFAMWGGTLMVNEDTSVIPPSDWIALVSSEIVLLAVCFTACLTPAVRASKANPLDIIRAI